MQQIKLFKSLESESSTLEKQVNQWLQESGVKVVNIFGNIAPQSQATDLKAITSGVFVPSDVFLVVVYEK